MSIDTFATRVELSSGREVWVYASPDEVVAAIAADGFIQVNDGYVNGAQVAQIQVALPPSILTPGRLYTGADAR
jgi:hypothetical protein